MMQQMSMIILSNTYIISLYSATKSVFDIANQGSLYGVLDKERESFLDLGPIKKYPRFIDTAIDSISSKRRSFQEKASDFLGKLQLRRHSVHKISSPLDEFEQIPYNDINNETSTTSTILGKLKRIFQKK